MKAAKEFFYLEQYRDGVLQFLFVKIRTVDGLDAVLDEEHWGEHIVSGHPELQGKLNLVIETLQNPDAVFRSKRDSDTRIYLKHYAAIMVGDHFIERTTLRVYAREDDGFGKPGRASGGDRAAHRQSRHAPGNVDLCPLLCRETKLGQDLSQLLERVNGY